MSMNKLREAGFIGDEIINKTPLQWNNLSYSILFYNIFIKKTITKGGQFYERKNRLCFR